MKAVIMAAPAMDGSTTSVADIDEPQPGPGQVAIDVAYAGVNFIDVMARRAIRGMPRPGRMSRAWRSRAPSARWAAVCMICTPASASLVHARRGHGRGRGRRSRRDRRSAAGRAARDRGLGALGRVDGAAPADRPGPHPLRRVGAHAFGQRRDRSVVSQVAAALGGGRRIGTVGRPDKIAAGLAGAWDEVFAREPGLAEAVRQVAPEGVDVILNPSALRCWIWTCRSRRPAGG